MKRPAILRPRRRLRVPELSLQHLTARRIETAQILHDGRIVAAQLRIRACLWCASEDLLSATTTQQDLSARHGELGECSNGGYRGSHARRYRYSLERRIGRILYASRGLCTGAVEPGI